MWGVFYARDRVLPYLEIAEEVGNTTAAEGRLVRRARIAGYNAYGLPA